MAIYIVSFSTSGNVAHALENSIKDGVNWARLCQNTFLIESDETAVDLRNKFSSFIQPNDHLYVGMVSAPAAWCGMDNDVSEWIRIKLAKTE